MCISRSDSFSMPSAEGAERWSGRDSSDFLNARIADVVGLTPDLQVRLSVQEIADPFAKQRMLFQHQDSRGDQLSWNAHVRLNGLLDVGSARSSKHMLAFWGEQHGGNSMTD